MLISGQANIEMAVRATKLGALDFLEKPLSTDKLLVTVENALRLSRLQDENRELRDRLGKHELVGSSPAMAKLLAQIDRVAASETRVCILGETGTGKELVARAIHEKSPRRESPFVTLNCAAVPAELIESELFGHEKGAFTGARRSTSENSSKPTAARYSSTRSATCPWPCRRNCCACWKRAKSNGWAGTNRFAVNVRVVVATHRNLEELVKQNAFRARSVSPHLRFSAIAAAAAGAPGRFSGTGGAFRPASGGAKRLERKVLADDAIAALRRYGWPGNVRELRNVVERLVLLAARGTVSAADVRAVASRRFCRQMVEQAALQQPLPEHWLQRAEAFERECCSAKYAATIFT